MSKPLRVLLVEDSDLDAAHLKLELRRGGFEPEITRVETADDFDEKLHAGEWDVIISDYHLPRFGAPQALDMYRLSRIDTPFIVVSGAIGEETAVELMRCGAHDYLLKHRMTRLAAAVERELQQSEDRRAKRRAENLFEAVLRASPLPAALVDRTTRQVVDGSDAFRRQFMFAMPGERAFFTLVEFSQPERIEQLVARGSGTAWYAVYYSGGASRMANVRCYSVEHEGTTYSYLIMEDVTEQHYLKAAFDAVPDPLLIISAQQQLLYANRAAEELFGNLYFSMDVTPVLQMDGKADWWRDAGRHAQRIEVKSQPYDASSVPFRFAGEPETSTILTLHNVTDEEELRRLATHDALTGIYNMRHFDAVLREQLRSDGGTLALLDLDYFKPINDELGHAAGDAALMMFTSILRHELRPSDVFARLGGDEFAVFFPNTPVEPAVQRVAAMYERLSRTPFRYDGTTRPFSASTGVAFAAPAESPESLKRRADEALYDAKRQGRGRWVVAAPVVASADRGARE
ncbi:MAG TPA: diguanylate cyclase [Thermoanaerobaculia bacterium]|jgi:diguanylate cyclase (GGDEF)-like protein